MGTFRKALWFPLNKHFPREEANGLHEQSAAPAASPAPETEGPLPHRMTPGSPGPQRGHYPLLLTGS